MSLPISLGGVVTAVDLAITLYEKIDDAKGQIKQLGEKLKTLRSYFGQLEELLVLYSECGIAAQRPQLISEITTTISKIKRDAHDAQPLLERWYKKEGPGGVEFRSATFAEWLYAWGSSPKKLNALTDDMEEHHKDLDRQLTLLRGFIQIALLNANLHKSPVPPSSPRKTECGIIFLDRANIDRSIISEAYIKLVRTWTEHYNGAWPLKFAHSAGYWTKTGNDCVELTSKVVGTMYPGNQPPNKTAMDALFDNNRFQYRAKQSIKHETEAKRSRGITKRLFSTYDYILVFDSQGFEMATKLKDIFKKELGHSMVPDGKGVIVKLGDFRHYPSSHAMNLWNPAATGDDKIDREKWNAALDNIKISVKNWSKKELGWTEPSH